MTIKKLIDQCSKLTPVENTIANYILAHTNDIMNSTIQDLADSLYVSKSAILRFCKKIGLSGFNDLKVKLAKEYHDGKANSHLINVDYPFFSHDTPKEIAHKLIELYEVTIKDTYACIDDEGLKTVAETINQAEIIDIYTHAHNFNIAENFQDKMLTIGKTVNCIENFYHQRLNALASNAAHVAIILSYSGKASWILSILKKLKEKNVTVIQIGKIGSNLYPNLISHHLAISNLESLRDRISQFSSHIALQYIMDVLYGCIYNMDHQKNSEYIYQSIDYMDDRKE